MLDALLRLSHQQFSRFGDARLMFAGSCHLPAPVPFIARKPQRDFLGFIADEARRLHASGC